MDLPLYRVRQNLASTRIENIAATLAGRWAATGLAARLDPGQRVAILAGSRGIDRLPEVLAAVAACCRQSGAIPFLVPAMGSHGGGTAEGQAAQLAALGVTAETTGCEVASSMETVHLGAAPPDIPVHVDAAAWGADWIVPVNRIKPHTKFSGTLGSGLCKMLAVGLGNADGAANLHRHAYRCGMQTAIRNMARHILDHGKILAGVGLIENGYGQLGHLEVVSPERMEEDEARLLALAKSLMPRIPFDILDILVVEEIGKDISGTGMDTNVTGRNRDLLESWDLPPHPRRIVVLDLTDATAGNALGIGYADFTTQALVDKIDLAKTRTNALTAVSPEKAAIPLALPSAGAALDAALASLGYWDPASVRVARIKNTKELEWMSVSEALFRNLPPGA